MGHLNRPCAKKPGTMKEELLDRKVVRFDTAGNKQGKADFGKDVGGTSIPCWTDLESSVSDNRLGSIFQPWEDSIVGRSNARISEAMGVQRAIGVTSGTTGANSTAGKALMEEGKPVIAQLDLHLSMTQAIHGYRRCPGLD